MTAEAARIAVIGHGAMARSLIAALAARPSGPVIGAVLSRHPAAEPLRSFATAGELIAWRPALAVECAGHHAVREIVPTLLAAGIDVILASIGALGEAGLLDRLADAATTGAARLDLVSGAVGGLDVLRAARLAGLDTVAYLGRKPPSAWTGTPAEAAVDLGALREPAVVFSGDARRAAAEFPKNANVTAAVALAGIGFERTRVTLVADPTAAGNSHEVRAAGAFGRFHIVLENRSLPDNPRTSWLAALSVEQAVLRHFQPLTL